VLYFMPMRAKLSSRVLFSAVTVSLVSAIFVVAPVRASVPAESLSYQQNNAHTGTSKDLLAAAPQLLWSANLGDRVSQALVVGGKAIVVAAPVCCATGPSVVAVDINSGAQQWAIGPISSFHEYAGIAADTARLYVESDKAVLSAYDLTDGALLWTTQLPGQSFANAAPVAQNGVVYATASGTGGTLYAVDAFGGNIEWSKPVANGDHSIPAVTKNAVYVSYACDFAYRFSNLGRVMWTHYTGCDGGGGRTPVLAGSKLFVRDDAGDSPLVLSSAKGQFLRSFVSTTTPVVDGGRVLSVSNGILAASRVSNGAVLWSQHNDDLVTAPIAVKGRVFVGASSGKVYAFSEKNGAVTWFADTGVPIAGPDEHNDVPLAGLSEGEHTLLVAAGGTLVAYR
jgi:outer membrane protein assembly factor BamB